MIAKAFDWSVVRDLIVAATALYGAVLSTVVLRRQRRAARPDLRVDVSLDSSDRHGLPLVRVVVVNAGKIAVTVEDISVVRLDERFPLVSLHAEPVLARTGEQDISGIELAPGKREAWTWQASAIVRALYDVVEEASPFPKIAVVVTDQVGNQFESSPIEVTQSWSP